MDLKHKNFLIVLVGLPGIGKTVVRERILKYVEDNYKEVEEPLVYSTDDWINLYASYDNIAYSEAFPLYISSATKTMNSDLKEDLARDNPPDVIWDQTNLTAKKRKKILSKFGNRFYKSCIWFDIPREHMTAYLHYRQLNERSGVHIPNKVIDSMKESFEKPTMSEGWDYISRPGAPNNDLWIQMTIEEIFGQ